MRNHITFLLNGRVKQVSDINPTTTLLNYLRRSKKLTGTKEGCAEGDCGACTVVVGELKDNKVRHQTINSCIQFLPMLEGKSVTTVEYLSDSDGSLHPCQQSMVDTHGSQCGFCTPGFVMSLYATYLSELRPDRARLNDILAGNLCRCTGYGPIIEAGRAMYDYHPTDSQLKRLKTEKHLLESLVHSESVSLHSQGKIFQLPASLNEFAEIYADAPESTIVAGATDVGLWVTKQHRELPLIISLARIAELAKITHDEDVLTIGAGVSCTEAEFAIGNIYRSFSELLRRFGSVQVRNAATIGGNIANGSPIGDSPPALIALGARLKLRKGIEVRTLSLENFSVDYGVQDLKPGEFVEAIEIPIIRNPDQLCCYKVSKRFDQDISTVCGCFNIELEGEKVKEARLCYGGMAATPKRAGATENALKGMTWNETTIEAAVIAMETDFKPLTDARGTAEYRMSVAQNLIRRYYYETQRSVGEISIVGRQSAFG